jgi:hypothetical protein
MFSLAARLIERDLGDDEIVGRTSEDRSRFHGRFWHEELLE